MLRGVSTWSRSKRIRGLPNDFERFAAIWPGPIFEFRLDYGPNSQPTEDIKVINNCLRIVSGNALELDVTESPLRVLNWARKSHSQLLTRAMASWGNVISSKEVKSFKGSNEKRDGPGSQGSCGLLGAGTR